MLQITHYNSQHWLIAAWSGHTVVNVWVHESHWGLILDEDLVPMSVRKKKKYLSASRRCIKLIYARNAHTQNKKCLQMSTAYGANMKVQPAESLCFKWVLKASVKGRDQMEARRSVVILREPEHLVALLLTEFWVKGSQKCLFFRLCSLRVGEREQGRIN